MSTPNFLEIERHARTLQSAAVRRYFGLLIASVGRALHVPVQAPRGDLGHAA